MSAVAADIEIRTHEDGYVTLGPGRPSPPSTSGLELDLGLSSAGLSVT